MPGRKPHCRTGTGYRPATRRASCRARRRRTSSGRAPRRPMRRPSPPPTIETISLREPLPAPDSPAERTRLMTARRSGSGSDDSGAGTRFHAEPRTKALGGCRCSGGRPYSARGRRTRRRGSRAAAAPSLGPRACHHVVPHHAAADPLRHRRHPENVAGAAPVQTPLGVSAGLRATSRRMRLPWMDGRAEVQISNMRDAPQDDGPIHGQCQAVIHGQRPAVILARALAVPETTRAAAGTGQAQPRLLAAR